MPGEGNGKGGKGKGKTSEDLDWLRDPGKLEKAWNSFYDIKVACALSAEPPFKGIRIELST
jgi:hypothetical protein